MKKNFSKEFLKKISLISENINLKILDQIIMELKKLKKNKGRLFFIGLGGSAANSSHAVNDFRKICNINSLSPIDNVSELTARINDDGWENVFKDWLEVSNLTSKDIVFFLSVGGGNKKNKVSENLIVALDYAKRRGSKILGIIGKKDGYIKKKGHNVLVIPEVDQKLITPLAESYQSIIWHLIVSHPLLKENKTKW